MYNFVHVSIYFISDLITAITSAFLQVYMHVLLGKAAMKNAIHEEAVRCVTSAQSLGPFGKVPRLDTIFLVWFPIRQSLFTRNHSRWKVFGWEYDSLWFEIHQQKCETLLASRRMKEATDFLKTVVNEFEYEMTFDKEKADWLGSKYFMRLWLS